MAVSWCEVYLRERSGFFARSAPSIVQGSQPFSTASFSSGGKRDGIDTYVDATVSPRHFLCLEVTGRHCWRKADDQDARVY